MRVITGKYKGRRFDIPRSFKARPTTDFAKENIFNVMQGYTDFDGAIALDLFSGTGSITLELLSRGCRQVVSIEADRDHHAFIRQCLDKVKADNCIALRADVFRFLKTCHQQFDVVFADPPYALAELPKLPRMIIDGGLLKPDGLLVFEHGQRNDFAAMPEFRERRAYGSVNFSIFKPTAAQTDGQADDDGEQPQE